MISLSVRIMLTEGARPQIYEQPDTRIS